MDGDSMGVWIVLPITFLVFMLTMIVYVMSRSLVEGASGQGAMILRGIPANPHSLRRLWAYSRGDMPEVRSPKRNSTR